MNRMFAAAAVAAPIIAAPAGAQEKYDWAYRLSVPTAAEAWRWLEDGDDGSVRRSFQVASILRFDPQPEEERNALAEGLVELVIRHAGREGSDTVVRLATRALYEAAVRYDALYFAPVGFPNGEVGHRASLEALQRIFETLEPFPLCYIEPEGVMPPDGMPWCEVRPPDSPWCMAGRALYSAEVDRAIGHKQRSSMARDLWFRRSEKPPEVHGLSEGAARWWSRCWDGRIMSG